MVVQKTDPKSEIYEAELTEDGGVRKLRGIALTEAIALRRNGTDVVVCGSDLAANRELAASIESQANGRWRRCTPHASAGPKSLPHYQPAAQLDTRFMKQHIAKRSDDELKFFTRELYIRFNSLDEREANEADEEWETAVREYQAHLASLAKRMPMDVERVASLCLHDAELVHAEDLFFDEAIR